MTKNIFVAKLFKMFSLHFFEMLNVTARGSIIDFSKTSKNIVKAEKMFRVMLINTRIGSADFVNSQLTFFFSSFLRKSQ